MSFHILDLVYSTAMAYHNRSYKPYESWSTTCSIASANTCLELHWVPVWAEKHNLSIYFGNLLPAAASHSSCSYQIVNPLPHPVPQRSSLRVFLLKGQNWNHQGQSGISWHFKANIFAIQRRLWLLIELMLTKPNQKDHMRDMVGEFSW